MKKSLVLQLRIVTQLLSTILSPEHIFVFDTMVMSIKMDVCEDFLPMLTILISVTLTLWSLHSSNNISSSKLMNNNRT